MPNWIKNKCPCIGWYFRPSQKNPSHLIIERYRQNAVLFLPFHSSKPQSTDELKNNNNKIGHHNEHFICWKAITKLTHTIDGHFILTANSNSLSQVSSASHLWMIKYIQFNICERFCEWSVGRVGAVLLLRSPHTVNFNVMRSTATNSCQNVERPHLQPSVISRRVFSKCWSHHIIDRLWPTNPVTLADWRTIGFKRKYRFFF